VEIPQGWQLSEEMSELVSAKYPDFVVVYGWFDPRWDEGKVNRPGFVGGSKP
jgi:hypothetical protein